MGVASLQDRSVLTDGQLLDRFHAQREQTAFAELVRRHGPMVFRVCQRVLGRVQDAEDAFQATFIVLAQRSETIAQQASVGSWLHGVAYRVALQARRRLGKERLRCGQVVAESLAGPAGDQLDSDLGGVLHEELQALPDKLRAPVVLCYLEGKTNAEAAQLLGYTTNAIEKQLIKARAQLRSRLGRRGLAVSAVALSTILAQEAAAAQVVPGLTAATVQSAALLATGKSAVGLASQNALWLAATSTPPTWLLKTGLALIGGAVATAALVVAWSLATAGDPVRLQPGLAITDDGFSGRAVAFSPDGKLLATTTGRARLVHLWDAATGQECAALDVKGRMVHGLRFSADGRRLALNAVLDHWEVWDVSAETWPTGRQLHQHVNPAVPGLWHTSHTDANFSPDLQLVVQRKSLGADAPASLREVATERELGKLPRGSNWQFFPDGQRLVGQADPRTLLICGVQTGAVQTTVDLGPEYDGQGPQGLPRFAVSPDNRTLVVGYRETLSFFDARTGLLKSRHLAPTTRLTQAPRPFAVVGHLVYSPDGRYLAVGGSHISAQPAAEGLIQLWRLPEETVCAELSVLPNHAPNGLAFDPASRRLAVCLSPREVKIWHLEE